MIIKLNNKLEAVAKKIHSIFQRSYMIEAKLIGANDFPPLSREVIEIINSSTDFFGFYDQQQLAAVVECGVIKNVLDIHSLTVDPDHFRKGIANKLMFHVLSAYEFAHAIVETAAANKPAIRLYEKHGFVEFKIWTPAHGIEKIALCHETATTNLFGEELT